MNEIITVRDSDIVAAEINTIKEDTRRIMIGNAIRIGGKLMEAKSMVPYGEWGKWLEEKVDYSQSTANNLMQLYKEYGENQASFFDNWTNSETFGKLSYSQHMAMLALPFADRLDFAEQHDVESLSIRELEKAIREELAAAERERDEIREELEEVRCGKDAAEKIVEELEGELAEARHQEQAQQELALAARDEATRLTGELEKAQRQAEQREKEAEKARTQMEAARKSEKSLQDQLEQLRAAPKIPAAMMQQLRLEAEQEAARKATQEMKKQLDAATAERDAASQKVKALEEKLGEAQRAAKVANPAITEAIVRAQKLQNDFNELNGFRLKQAATDPGIGDSIRRMMADMVKQWETALKG